MPLNATIDEQSCVGRKRHAGHMPRFGHHSRACQQSSSKMKIIHAVLGHRTLVSHRMLSLSRTNSCLRNVIQFRRQRKLRKEYLEGWCRAPPAMYVVVSWGWRADGVNRVSSGRRTMEVLADDPTKRRPVGSNAIGLPPKVV